MRESRIAIARRGYRQLAHSRRKLRPAFNRETLRETREWKRERQVFATGNAVFDVSQEEKSAYRYSSSPHLATLNKPNRTRRLVSNSFFFFPTSQKNCMPEQKFQTAPRQPTLNTPMPDASSHGRLWSNTRAALRVCRTSVRKCRIVVICFFVVSFLGFLRYARCAHNFAQIKARG